MACLEKRLLGRDEIEVCLRNASPRSHMVTAREIKVGAFVLVGMVLTGMVIFMIGEERQLFTEKVPFKTVFDDVEGVKRGSTVRMGGIDIGNVDQVAYGSDPNDLKLYVSLRIATTDARRIRKNSRAKIETKGLLGDKVITIVAGTPDQPVLPPGGVIEALKDPQDLASAMGRVGNMSSKAEQTLENLAKLSGEFANAGIAQDVKSSTESLSHVLASADTGNGYLAKLLSDPHEAQRIGNMISGLERSAAELEKTLTAVSAIAHRIDQGPGLVHELIYGEGSAKSVEQIGMAAEQLALTLKGIREGNGLARAALFGDDSQQLNQRLDRILGNVEGMLVDMRAGKGTLGALLVDPSVYEDLKVVLGNVERNKALRALVRYSIQSSGNDRAVEVKDPVPATAVKPSASTAATEVKAAAPAPTP
jgi:phospholipid/cholesterol/gamma-HCH transport system substrate-binding protein